jgi:hypothetical protein
MAPFGGAERQHVDAAPPGRVRRSAAERGNRVGEAGAVHVHSQAVRAGDADQLIQLVQPVNRAALGRLREVERGRLDPPGVPDAGALERGPQRLGAQPAVLLGERHDLGAAGIELPGPALALVHVTDVSAVDRAVGRRDQRQGERVGRGAGRHRLHEAAGLEQLGEDALEARGDRVGAVRRRGAGVRRLDRREDLGGDAGDVVAAQIDRRRPDRQHLHVPPPATALRWGLQDVRRHLSSFRSAAGRGSGSTPPGAHSQTLAAPASTPAQASC